MFAAPDDSTNETIVTKEMFLRDLLEEPVVKRKKAKRTEYKVLDNRDSLPFSVRVATPDPYTHPDLKRRNAQKVKKRRDSIEECISSALHVANDGTSDARTLLGEFHLDKHTTTGDLLHIGNVEYRVVKHRCLYKYAGGKRFVLVKKDLQVKEVGRLQTEEYLKRQWKDSAGEATSSS